MRRTVSLLLVAAFLACPQLCRAEAMGCCADDAAETGPPGHASRAPEPVQDKAASCLCAGAIRSLNSRAAARTGLGHGSDDLSRLGGIAPERRVSPPVAQFGRLPKRTPRGPLRLHLMLQTFRC